MFLDIDRKNRNHLAMIDDDNRTMTYGELTDLVRNFESLNLGRSVVFCLCENSSGSLGGFVALESNKMIPLLLSQSIDKELLDNLVNIYKPSYFWVPERIAGDILGSVIFRAYGYSLLETENAPYPVHESLSLLLTTSGSTGSPKLVRHKYGNIEANAKNVASVFQWRENDKGICDLPMNYTMGLNVINSHLYAGATVILMKRNLMDPEFWKFVKEQGATDFCGVPFSYEIMRRIRFDKMGIDSLRIMAEGGGKLTEKMFKWVANYCKDTGKLFYATFGTTETSARIAYLDPERAMDKVRSIGKAIPEGELFLNDETVNDDLSADGELGYKGPNVTMGYAVCREDLEKGDEFNGVYLTGDIAHRDQEGFYYIVGRKKRFLKLFGIRVGLDETEQMIKAQYNCDCVCSGTDKCMNIFVTDAKLTEEIRQFVSNKTKIHISVFKVIAVDSIPRNSYGKIKYAELDALA